MMSAPFRRAGPLDLRGNHSRPARAKWESPRPVQIASHRASRWPPAPRGGLLPLWSVAELRGMPIHSSAWPSRVDGLRRQPPVRFVPHRRSGYARASRRACCSTLRRRRCPSRPCRGSRRTLPLRSSRSRIRLAKSFKMKHGDWRSSDLGISTNGTDGHFLISNPRGSALPAVELPDRTIAGPGRRSG